ncbi:PAS domain S-box protein [Planktothrix agardhii]|uniref:PAS domain S-box protein n=1 Tax=Planktothrix agardhii TaxID=1160 RepID=UPI0020A71BED|nr:PAS domain S-box protein [Planktothrix agardhii]CAD5962115.1 Alginate biosynthesis sensor protein KinB [Planktothrix agardhii]
MTTSEICSHFPNRGYQVLQSPTWDARWQMNQFLGVIHDLIVIIDCEQQQIHVLPTKASPNLSSESNPFSWVLQELKNCQESSEFPHLIQQVIETQIAQNIIYKCDQDRSDYHILVEIYPLSTTEVIAVIKDLSQCSTVKAVLQKVSEKTHSPTPTPTPVLQTTQESLKRQIEERQRIETQLQARKTELETLMDNAGDSIVRLDKKLRYVFVNRRTAVLIQITQEKFIGKTNWELGISDPVAQEWDQNCQQVLDTGQPQQFEFDLETSEGLRSFQTLIVPEIQQGGEVKTLLATTRDITQQKRTFAETQKQNQFLNLLTEITSKIRQSLEINLILKTTVEEVQKVLNVDRVIMLKLDSQRGGTVVQEAVIPQWLSLLSHRIYTPELIPYLSDAAVPDRVLIFSDLSQENLDACYLELMEFFQVKASLIVPIWLEKKEIDSMITPPKNPESTNDSSDPKPKLWGFMMAYQCAEPRQWATLETNFLKQLADQVGIALKQAQLIAELKQAHQCLSCHFDNSPLVVIEWDQQLKIKRWSSQAERIFGWTSAEVLGQQWSTFQEVFATNILQVNQEMIQLIDGTNNHQIIEAQNRTKDGRVIDCEWYNSVVRDEGGNLVSLLSLAQNVSDRKQSEQKLLKSEERFRTIFEQAAVGFAVVDLSGELLRVNQRYCEIIGYSEKDLIGQTIHNFIHYPNSAGMEWLEQIQDQDLSETFSIEKQYIRPNGQRNWVQIFVSTLDQLWQGKKYILLALEDIQERKQTEEALRKSEERWQLALRGNNDGIWDWNIQTEEVFFSPRWKEMLGYHEQEVCDHLTQWNQRVHPDDLPWVMKVIREHLDQKIPFYITEHRVQCKDGSYKWILDRGQVLWDDQENLVRMVGSYTDISDRKRAEEELHRVNRALRTISDCNQVLVRATTETELLHDVCQILINIGGYHFAWVGYTQYTQGKQIIPIAKAGFEAGYLDNLTVTWDDSEWGQGPSGTAVRTGQTCVFQNFETNGNYAPWKQQAQKRGYTSSIAMPLIMATDSHNQHLQPKLNGEILSIPFGVLNLYSTQTNAFDPAEVKLLKELVDDIVYGIIALRIRASHAETERDKLIAIIEATPDFISSAKPEGEVVYYNQSARRILGLDPEGKISNQDIPQNHPEWAVEVIKNHGVPAAIRDGSWIGETALTSYDGREIPLSQLIIAHKNQEGQVYLLSTMARDITEQKRSQANLREAERRWRSLLENVRLLVVGLDRNGKVEYVNPFLLEVMGYTQTEVLGKNWLGDFQTNPAHELNSVAFAELLDYNFKPYSQQLIVTKLGEEKIISWNNTLLKDLQGNAIGMMSIGEDITERYAIERMKDEFISVVSHELRTPLTSIHGGLNLLSTGLINPQSERGVHVMKIAAESAERLVRLVNDILELERLESGKICLNKQVVNAADLLLQATEQMQVMASRSGINLEVSSKSLQFYADPDRVLQVLTNLLSNAIKFSESGGGNIKLSVETELPENLEETPKILFKIQD